MELLATKAAEKKLDLACLVDDTIPKILVSDVTRLRQIDRKSTRLNSSHLGISYRVFFPDRRSSELCSLSLHDALPISEKKLDLACLVDDTIPKILVSDVTRLRQ